MQLRKYWTKLSVVSTHSFFNHKRYYAMFSLEKHSVYFNFCYVALDTKSQSDPPVIDLTLSSDEDDEDDDDRKKPSSAAR